MAVTRILTAEIPDPRRYRACLTERTVRILTFMLNKSPEARFATAGALSQALEEEMYSIGYGPTVVKLAAYTEALLAGAAAYVDGQERE
jgi:hypothetical protein